MDNIRGIGKERVFRYVTPDGMVPVWDSNFTPWKKIYITEDEYLRLSKEEIYG